MKELVIKKCEKCGAIVEVIKDCTCDNCGIKCCGEEMKVISPNELDKEIFTSEHEKLEEYINK